MTRLALISDIHGNAVALEAVLDDLVRFRSDRMVCLGDVAAGGPQPRETLARLRALGCSVVFGNADAWLLEGLPRDDEQADRDDDPMAAIVDWARAQLDAADIAFLRSFEPTVELELEGVSLLCFHGSPRTANERILAETPQATLEAMLAGHSASIYTGGHTHLQLLRRLGESLYLNPGSVGLPLPAGKNLPSRVAEYAVVKLDSKSLSVMLRRVAVDPTLVGRAAASSGMPAANQWSACLTQRIVRRNAEAIETAD